MCSVMPVRNGSNTNKLKNIRKISLLDTATTINKEDTMCSTVLHKKNKKQMWSLNYINEEYLIVARTEMEAREIFEQAMEDADKLYDSGGPSYDPDMLEIEPIGTFAMVDITSRTQYDKIA